MAKAKQTPEEKAKAKQAEQARRMDILAKLGRGELSAAEADKLLNQKPDREWEVRPSADGQKVSLYGPYSRFPITFYPAHAIKMEEEGYWEQIVALARKMIEEQGDKSGDLGDLEAPPTEKEAAAA